MSRGDLVLDSTRKTALTKAAAYGMRQYLWGTILSTSYANWTADAQMSNNPMCRIFGAGNEQHPFGNMGDSGRWLWAAPNSNGTPVHWWIAQNQTSDPGTYLYKHNAVGLPANVTDQLFGPIDVTKAATDDTNNIGAVAPYFQLQYLPLMAVQNGNDEDASGHYGTGCFKDGQD
jgi:hypothetical protein